MDNPSHSGHQPARSESKVAITITLADLQIIEKYRGSLSVEDFVSTLLRMIDSGAVSSAPEWARLSEKPGPEAPGQPATH